ncbi:hypothetical protein [Rheinheimera sp. UJ63]|uniref:hypothetical protein n=1 Tax=Rheinheimera sp. UJ63 TaxID=2910157 RepID=UPI001F4765EA|nr:hypothetical protein [Rheinheimera sp. UJ63]MCF4010672.1 hypothetical protein [Rheinheimera sp. UJ63]
MQQNTLRHKVDMLSILTHAKEAIANAAATIDIDAGALLPCLPDHSVFLKGNEVPVLAKRYKGCCSVRFYYNHTSDGQPWPFFRFYTFKDGGLSIDFNGLRWLGNSQNYCYLLMQIALSQFSTTLHMQSGCLPPIRLMKNSVQSILWF